MLRGALAILLLTPVVLDGASSLLIVAPAAPGGGWDQTARVMQRALASVEPDVTVQVDNVPGAAGTIGLARFVQSERGNPDALLVTGLVMVSGVITNGAPVSLADATPIARLTGESEVIVVPAASPYRTMQELAAAFTAEPGAISWGGGSAGGTDDLLVRLMAEQLGLPASRVNYIAFAGGGAALAAVLGGQVTAAVSGYNEFAGQIAAGQLRPLAISAPEPVEGIDVPTLRETGIALDLANWRAVVAPPGLSDAERDALTGRVVRMAESKAWKTMLAQNGWEDRLLAGAAFRQFLFAEQARIDAVLQRLAANDTARPAGLDASLTARTVPRALAALFGAVAIAFGVGRIRTRSSAFGLQPSATKHHRSVVMLGGALLIQPLLFSTIGFVLSSAFLFAIGGHALRGGGWSRAASLKDLVIGLAFSALLYLTFSAGLGVSLP